MITDEQVLVVIFLVFIAGAMVGIMGMKILMYLLTHIHLYWR